jgi:hypothetical protein
VEKVIKLLDVYFDPLKNENKFKYVFESTRLSCPTMFFSLRHAKLFVVKGSIDNFSLECELTLEKYILDTTILNDGLRERSGYPLLFMPMYRNELYNLYNNARKKSCDIFLGYHINRVTNQSQHVRDNLIWHKNVIARERS